MLMENYFRELLYMRVGPIVFLIVVFSLVLLASSVMREPMQTQTQPESKSKGSSIKCPKVLIKKGEQLILYDDANNEIQNFASLDEYIDYLKNERARGISCPVLFLQKENDTQGRDVYRVRPGVFDQQGGMAPVDIAPIIDANRKSKIYNVNNYPGFDPLGLQIGVYTQLDAVHDSTEKAKTSDNPMDTNWGGVEFTQDAIESGKYEDNEVGRPTYFNPKTQFFPNLYKEHPVPKSYANTDLSV
jgi:hypothetical protein